MTMPLAETRLRPVADTLGPAIAAFMEEGSELELFLDTLAQDDFTHPTPLDGWRVEDVVRHLVALDRMALLALTHEHGFAEARAALLAGTSRTLPNEPAVNPNFARLRQFHQDNLGLLCVPALLARWREGRLSLAAAVMEVEDRKLEWFGPPMRVSRLLAARQMETWAYGQDIYDGLGVHRVNGDRLYQVVDFGVRTRGFAFAVNGLPVPDAPCIELLSPSGRVWHWGEPNGADRITGAAEDFALVATQRRNIADVRLQVSGEGATQWMQIAQTIAGAPITPPEPGERAIYGVPVLPHAPTVPAMVEHLVRRYRDRPQVIADSGAVSFREMAERSRAIAAGLLALGAAKGARIGVFMPNGADCAAAMLGVQRAGCVAVLISTFAKGRELAHMIRHCDAHMLLLSDCDFSHDLLERLESALPALAGHDSALPLWLEEAPYLRAAFVWGQGTRSWARPASELVAAGAALAETLVDAAQAQVVAADPALIIYTSGSQAEPKAVVHGHAQLVGQAHRMSAYTTYQPGDRMTTTMPFFWVGGLLTGLLSAGYSGAAVVCPATPDGADVIDAIERFGVTHVMLWPAQLAAVLGADTSGTLLKRLRPNSAQQLGLFGQAPVERTPNSLGMTETLGPHSMEFYGSALPPEAAGSFGRQVGTIERATADPQTGALIPQGTEGEILLRGGHMMLGMHRQTREDVFRADGWYRTGDMGRIDAQGHLHFLGRLGDIVKTAGANVSPQEVERALNSLPQVQESAVLGLPDPLVGELLVAVVVPAPGATPDEDAIKAALRADLSSYKVPKRIHFMQAHMLPRTSSAKVQKHRLRELLVAQRRS